MGVQKNSWLKSLAPDRYLLRRSAGQVCSWVLSLFSRRFPRMVKDAPVRLRMTGQRLPRQKPKASRRANRCPIIFRAKMSCCLPVRRASSAAGYYVISARMCPRRWSMCLDGSKSSEPCGPNCHAAAVRPFIRFRRPRCQSNAGGWGRA